MLVKEEDKVQKPIYYVSKILIGAEAKYIKIKKLTYALMIISRKLLSLFSGTSYCCIHRSTLEANYPLT